MTSLIKILAIGFLSIYALWPVYAQNDKGLGTVPSPKFSLLETPDKPIGYYSGDPLPPKTIYLTFDDGPWEFTNEIVDILHEEGVRATFFMNSFDKDNPFHADTGKNLMFRFTKALKKMVKYGDIIGDHTYSHRDLAVLTPSQINFQLTLLQKQLTEVLGTEMPVLHLMRPPYGSPWLGHWNTTAQREKVTKMLEGHYIVVMWTLGWDSADSINWVPGEWYESDSKRYHPANSNPYRKKMAMEMHRILSHAVDGHSGVILMHDTHPTSRDILKKMIETLKSRGYKFDTMDDYCRWRWGADVFDHFSPLK